MAGQSTSLVYDRRFEEPLNKDLVCFDCKVERAFGCEKSRPQSALLSFAMGPSRIDWSSSTLSSHGMLLERHFYLPGERRSAAINKHVISMLHSAPARFEYRGPTGHFTAAVIRPRAIMMTPTGSIPDIRLHTSTELTHCALPDGFVRRVAEEIGHDVGSPKFRPALEDRSIQRILDLLLDEREAPFPSGQLYVDSLVYALATRYLLMDSGRTDKPKARVIGLLPRILNRIREKVEGNLDADLSLDSLAEESGYSRAYFFRIFREATGLTPHEYVLNSRLKRAQELLKQANSSIIDVALSCGFSSQSHMTSVFRRHLATTPGEFRRDRVR